MKLYLYLLFSFFILFTPAYASTSYETASPVLSSYLTQTGGCCSGADNYSQHTDYLPLPSGLTFNNVILAGTSTGSNNFAIYLMRDDGAPLSAYLGNGSTDPISDDTFISTLQSDSSWTNVGGILQSPTFATTTIAGSNYYLNISYTSGGSFSLNRSIQTSEGYRFKINSSAPIYTLTSGTTAMKLCYGLCDGYTFSAVPNLTATPWARLISPNSGATILGGQTQPLSFQVNTGTTTADNVEVRFTSTLQSLVPYSYTITSTGINSFTYNLNLPSLEDTITFIVDVRSGTTTLFTSPDYTINVTTNPNDVDLGLSNDPSLPAACDNIVIGALCGIAVWLFYPGDLSTTFFSDTLDNLNTKKPFSYFGDATNIIQSVATSSASSSFQTLTITVPLTGTPLTILSQASLDSIYPSETRLYVRTVIAYGLWILLLLTLIYMLLNIFNRAVYTGEQHQSFENRVKTKHER